ncbi:hypothetical protein PQX77_003547 [Marasmius sp. AFHP31]|nr:hypothetical protein PQX77_003547 [Marasmius sp. AFHP31]
MAQHINYGRDQFNGNGNVQVNNFVARKGRLWDEVAGVGASHLSQQQFDRGLECLEGTRVAIIDAILNWLASKDSSSPICWLSGAAGVGKSSIAMTVAKSCAGTELASSFFFFRPDPKRNNPSAFVLSIAHGLTERMPFARGYINERIAKYPTILEASMEDQFRQLVFKPCVRWRQLRHLMSKLPLAPKEPTLVIIDGLDECSGEETQRHILSTILSSYKQSRHFPLRFLICSRPEKWIREAFDEENVRGLVRHFRLDDEVFPNRDIELYYLCEFTKILRSAQFARLPFPKTWPSPEDLERLVNKSSGQFVYAATMVKVVCTRGSNPITQLRNILDYTVDNPSRPFAAVDLLYHMILSDHHNPKQLIPVLAAIFMLPPHAPSSPEFIELLLGLPPGEIDIILRPMHSVLNIGDADIPIVPFHASFMEFLYDELRSEGFYIDASAQRDILARQWVQALKPADQPSFSDDPTKCALWDGWVEFCCGIERPSTGLLSGLQELDLMTASLNVAFIHHKHEKPTPIIIRRLRAAVSWLTPMDGLLPAKVTDHFQETLEWFESAIVSESDEGVNSIPGELRRSPSQNLYALYDLMLAAHPDYENVRPILTAILVLPPHLKLSPACLGLLFGLPPGEVILALQGLHLVLAVEDEIRVRHRSFEEYLIDRNKSHVFHVDIPVQSHIIAQQWLGGLSDSKMRTYSFDQLYGDRTKSFFTEWMGFCNRYTEPTTDLMDRLLDIDFASVFFCRHFSPVFANTDWVNTFRAFHDWMLKLDPGNDYAYYLQQVLVNKLRSLPKSFHLEQSGPLQDDDLVVAVLLTTECRLNTRLASNARGNYQRQAPLRITECHCNAQSTENKPDDLAKHLAYQEACTRIVRILVTEFEVLAKTAGNGQELEGIFRNILNSWLLQHCHLDAELLLLCNTFFASARGCLKMKFHGGKIPIMKARLHDWIEVCTAFLVQLAYIVDLVTIPPLATGVFFLAKTFPESFAQEAATLQAQVNALPWDEWKWW